jgi:hypothetical protein
MLKVYASSANILVYFRYDLLELSNRKTSSPDLHQSELGFFGLFTEERLFS